MRLRAMYVQGNDSLASALVGATDFYDLLSKYELMSRVANHDNELVNDLKDKLETCNEKKAELETEKSDLEQQQSDQQQKKDESRLPSKISSRLMRRPTRQRNRWSVRKNS